MISSAFVSKLISFMTSTTESPIRPAWLTLLGDIPLPERSPVLDLALQAAATAFCGVDSKNPPVIMEASRLYGQALSRQSAAISKYTKEPSTGAICTSVILSLFEAIWATNTTAYATHLSATRTMLDLLGEKLSQNELLKQIATHVQYQTVHNPMFIVQADLLV
jgi:hypothetical protein